MAFRPEPYALVDGELAGSFGLALRSGRLVATVVSRKTGKHIAVQLRSKRREGKRFRACELAEAERVYIDTPGEGTSREIGILHLAGKWAGKILPPWEQDFDAARVWAARRILDVAHGRAELADDQAEILQGELCLMCGRELTDPESIARNIGPECWKRATGLDAGGGEHQAPGAEQELFSEGSAEDGANGEAEVIANDKRHADIEKIEVTESKTYAEAQALYAERAARGEVDDPAAFAERCLAPPSIDDTVDELQGKVFDGAGNEVDVREQIEAELKQTVLPPEAGEDLDALPAEPPVVAEGMVLLRAGDDPRELLERESE